jgi:hypothetical protein
MGIYDSFRGLWEGFKSGGHIYELINPNGKMPLIVAKASTLKEYKEHLPKLIEVAMEEGALEIQLDWLINDLQKSKQNIPFRIAGVHYVIGKDDMVSLLVRGQLIKDHRKWIDHFKGLLGVDVEIYWLNKEDK